MFDIGWTELLVIAIVLIVVVGPKDLPPMLRAFGKMTSNLRKMAGDFRTQFDEALRESELDDVRKTISDAQRLNPTNALREAINPLRQMGQDIRNDIQRSTQVAAAPEMTKTDVEAQQAVEGAPAIDSTPEIPANFPSPGMNLPSGPPVISETAPAQSQSASTGTVSATPAAIKSKPVRKSVKPVADVTPVAVAVTVEKPKRSRAAARPIAPVEPVVQLPQETVANAPARKRAPKKTDTPKGDA
jgi:sec-independent protein translocase protein TatB